MSALFIVGIIALNGFISWWNCKVAGSIWVEAHKFGGFMKVLVWCAVIQSVVGFSSVIIILLGFGAYATGHLPQDSLQQAMSLWYLMVIFPALGSGLIITIHSLITAWRDRNLANIGTAAWNTFAQGMNMYNAVSDIPNAWGNVTELFSGGDSKDDRKAALVVLIVIVAIGGGIALTFGLVRHYAKQNLPQRVAV